MLSASRLLSRASRAFSLDPDSSPKAHSATTPTRTSSHRRSSSIDPDTLRSDKRQRTSYTRDAKDVESIPQTRTTDSTTNDVFDALFTEPAVDSGSQIERTRTAMLWRLSHTKQEIALLEQEIHKLEQSASEPASLSPQHLLVNQLLTSNDAALTASATASSSLALDLPALANTAIPHMPAPELDLDRLRRFTGLEITSDGTEVEFASYEQPLDDQQVFVRTARHSISITHPSSTISFSLSLVVNQSSLEVISFSVLDSSIRPTWARAPLQRWISNFSSTDDDSFQQLDISCFLFGVADMARITHTRAQVFANIARAFPHLVHSSKYTKLRESLDDLTSKPEPDEEEEEEEEEDSNKLISASGLITWLGESTLVAQQSQSSLQLVVSWTIEIEDVTGDATSNITARVTVPENYNKLDDAQALLKIPNVFQTLVQTRGVFRATSIIIRNLFEE
ncbi:hypothetical protein BZA70DRAFT_282054 [Myxozyma melibiosi]|uniref:Uncharacterized protein n=1 Tax=Myxozyma melibiosi TaxID=54550 RepID=A0ABR1F1P9_9ASCO